MTPGRPIRNRTYRSPVYDSRRWDDFKPRPGDIIVCTPAKSGTTWTQMLCALIVHQSVTFPRPLNTLTKWIDRPTEPIEEVLAGLERQPHRRLVKTHTPLDGLPYFEEVSYVFCGRDPRDVYLSQVDHMANLSPETLAAEAARAGTRIYLLGGRDGVSERTARRMIQQFPDLAITGSASGYFIDAAEEERTIAAINASGAQIVLVGLGVPRQERWIARNRSKLRAPVLVGVGGLFDYYSGRLPRAPRALRKMGLEWTWRLAMEPRRLASRYLIGNARFLARLAWLHLLSPDDFDQSRVARR